MVMEAARTTPTANGSCSAGSASSSSMSTRPCRTDWSPTSFHVWNPLALRDDVTGLRVDGAKPTPNQGVHPVLGPEEGGEVGHEVEAEGAELLGEVGDVCRRHHVLPQVAQQAGHVGRRRFCL